VGESVELVVSDIGMGILECELEYFFECFYCVYGV